MSTEPQSSVSEDTEPLELPALQVAVLNEEQLARLFRDLSLVAQVLEVRAKGSPMAHASVTAWTLERARDALASGEVGGVQIRYRHESEVWCDTLMRSAEGVRLVRMKDASAPAPAP